MKMKQPKANRGGGRVTRIMGWKWLREHPRRHEIMAWVAASASLPPPAWMRADPNWDRIQRDRVIVQTRVSGHSARSSALAVMEKGWPCSSQHVLNTVRVYLHYESVQFEETPHLDLRSRARQVLTRAVIAECQAGVRSVKEIAQLLNPRCPRQHAHYWIRKMTQYYRDRPISPESVTSETPE